MRIKQLRTKCESRQQEEVIRTNPGHRPFSCKPCFRRSERPKTSSGAQGWQPRSNGWKRAQLRRSRVDPPSTRRALRQPRRPFSLRRIRLLGLRWHAVVVQCPSTPSRLLCSAISLLLTMGARARAVRLITPFPWNRFRHRLNWVYCRGAAVVSLESNGSFQKTCQQRVQLCALTFEARRKGVAPATRLLLVASPHQLQRRSSSRR